MIELERIWILPPLAFARVGSAVEPCQAFSWAPPVLTPDGEQKTVLRAEDTIAVNDAGEPTVLRGERFSKIALKDANGRFFPVCPFFELHGRWTEEEVPKEGPITPELLEAAGISLDQVRWTVRVANLKPFHYTLVEADKVIAEIRVLATDTARKPLEGLSPQSAPGEPLVPGPQPVVLGHVQAIRRSDELPGLRLRIYAPAGKVYAPSDLDERIVADEAHEKSRVPSSASRWATLHIPVDDRILNPNSRWAQTGIEDEDAPGPVPRDFRVNPSGLAATYLSNKSLGLVDDVSDGIVLCQVEGLAPATARIVIGPPDFAPDTRPIVSLQDGLADRLARCSVNLEDLEVLVADIFERALETSDFSNKDAQTGRAHATNQQIFAQIFGQQNPGSEVPPFNLSEPSPDFEQPPIGTLWPLTPPGDDVAARVDALPVSFKGERKHRRLNALEYLKDRLRSDPDFVARWVRPPRDQFPYYDRRMPPLMRGSDRQPMHLTRRQYEIIRLWARSFVAAQGGAA